MNANQFIVQQEARKHQHRLESWASQVIATRDNITAFRLAANSPPGGSMGMAIRPMTRGDAQRAKHKVERNLEKRLTQMSPDEVRQHQDMLRRCTQGHYPSLFRRIISISRDDG